MQNVWHNVSVLNRIINIEHTYKRVKNKCMYVYKMLYIWAICRILIYPHQMKKAVDLIHFNTYLLIQKYQNAIWKKKKNTPKKQLYLRLRFHEYHYFIVYWFVLLKGIRSDLKKRRKDKKKKKKEMDTFIIYLTSANTGYLILGFILFRPVNETVGLY